jgi:hypothetical protein
LGRKPFMNDSADCAFLLPPPSAPCASASAGVWAACN